MPGDDAKDRGQDPAPTDTDTDRASVIAASDPGQIEVGFVTKDVLPRTGSMMAGLDLDLDDLADDDAV
ncbi:MAG TPA: hypothetical protein VN840_17360 [Streptosporangiaceae bacterium]|nr:hypothetical protein [Streptosporangiaceae bacterium]